jgi:hypothetical protein
MKKCEEFYIPCPEATAKKNYSSLPICFRWTKPLRGSLIPPSVLTAEYSNLFQTPSA